jgi:hypothetical protein
MSHRVIVFIPVFYFVMLLADAAAQDVNIPDADKTGDSASWDIEGEYEIKFDYRKNFSLHRGRRDDLFLFEQEFQLRWSYRYNDWISYLLEGKLLGEHQLYTGGSGRRSEFDPERGETWVRFDQLFGRDLSLKLGRQNFEEPRRWWWDDDLDAAGLRYRGDSVSFELGAGRELPRKSLREEFSDPENEGVSRVLTRAQWRYFENHGLDFFFLHHNDRSRTPAVGSFVSTDSEDDSDARLWWSGIRASGNEPVATHGEISYWADVASVFGRESLLEFDRAGNHQVVSSKQRRQVRGWALDLGVRWASTLPAEPLFTLGYAIGSGDKRPERGTDTAFRQTGLQSTDEEFRIYGELLQPELSNLRIPVVAVQFPILSRSHIEFAYRHFRQVHAAPFLRDARIETDPTGKKKNIGQEWMLYSLLKEWKNIEIELVGAAFRSGNAYGALSGRMAYSLFTKITYEF